MNQSESRSLREIAALFLKMGTIGFGGPAAHIAMMEDEVVTRRSWLSRQRFLDLLGATNLIPGPNSTEMAIHLGYLRGGWRGLIVSGACFILPAVAITAIVAFIYMRYGTLPQAVPVLAGIKPVVVAIVAAALLKLGTTAVKDWRLALVGIAVAAIALRQGHEVLALLGGGLVGMVWLRARGSDSSSSGAGWGAALLGLGSHRASEAVTTTAGPGPGASKLAAAAGAGLTAAAGASSSAAILTLPLWQLGLFFLKVGAVLFGSGYVLFAFLEGELVSDLHLLTRAQLLDAIAVGQFTPGPVLSTATFVGYIIAGPAGAIVATVAIFLPSFAFVAAVNPIIPRLRQSAWAAAFLDSVNVSAVGLMAVVTFELGQTSLVDSFSWWLAAMTLLGMRVVGLSPGWFVLAGGITGWLIAR